MPRIIPADDLPSHGIKLSNAQRRLLESQKLFPRRVNITARSHGYVESEITDYLDSRIAARDTAAQVA
jgi:predicted DNA-binding transcriptional regulator AlpA